MRITVDTNIIFQALYSSSGASHQILKLIREGELELVLSIPVNEEYCDVLRREGSRSFLNLSLDEINAVLEFIAMVGEPYHIDYLWRPNLRDEKDNIFVELAFNSGSEYLITRNIKDFVRDNELIIDSFDVIAPNDFLSLWRNNYEKK
ncbi:MAG: putative toxin-antitoxin system toxin component, PIN family [Spirochaetales bacterium]|nr:putative toxin-antitoxin system toxin component, PIN family [Spirochaetales bacterium]